MVTYAHTYIPAARQTVLWQLIVDDILKISTVATSTAKYPLAKERGDIVIFLLRSEMHRAGSTQSTLIYVTEPEGLHCRITYRAASSCVSASFSYVTRYACKPISHP